MMQWFWYWLGSKLQHRYEERVATADHAADRVLASADPDYARALGILPPLPTVNNFYMDGLAPRLFGENNLQQQQAAQMRIAQMLQQAQQGLPQSMLLQQMLGPGPDDQYPPWFSADYVAHLQQSRKSEMLRGLGGGLGAILGGPTGSILGAGLGSMLGGREKH